MNFVLFSDMFYVNLCHNVATMSFVTLVRHPPQYRLYCTVLYCTVFSATPTTAPGCPAPAAPSPGSSSPPRSAAGQVIATYHCRVELSTNIREVFTITERAPTCKYGFLLLVEIGMLVRKVELVATFNMEKLWNFAKVR